MKHVVLKAVVAVTIALWVTGCGYTTRSSLDPKYRTIAVSRSMM